MDGHEPKFTVVIGLATTLVLNLITETNAIEDLQHANVPRFIMVERPGATPILDLEATVNVPNGQAIVELLPEHTEDLTVGTYVAVFEMGFPVEAVVPTWVRSSTERVYVEVVERVGVDPP